MEVDVFLFSEAAKGNRLRRKVTVNMWITEAVALAASVNQLTETDVL